MGFTGPQQEGLLNELAVDLDGRGNVVRDGGWATTVPGVFVAGDMGRGHAFRRCGNHRGPLVAAALDTFLTGSTTPAVAGRADLAVSRRTEVHPFVHILSSGRGQVSGARTPW